MISRHIAHITLAGHRPRTIKSRREVLQRFRRDIHPRELEEATRSDVEHFLARDLKPASRRAYLGHLRSFYSWALAEGMVEADPTARIPAIRVPVGTPRPLAPDHLALALDEAPPRMRAWLLLMALEGLRCIEVAGLRPCDLVEVEGSKMLYLRECKGGGTATMPAHPAVVEALEALPVRNGLWWEVNANTISTVVSRFLHGLGIDATAHRLRHTAGTSWYRASGNDLLTTARLLRHARVSTTQIYAQLDPQRPAEVVRLVSLPGGQESA